MSLKASIYLFFLLITYSWSGEQAVNTQIVSGEKQLNIILFVADDLGYNDIGPYGHEHVRTPHLDRFSETSLLFNQAFASSPTCSPSRASIYTGLYPFRNGAHANHSGIREGVRTLPEYLQQLGYQTALAGKYHVGPEKAYPFEIINGTNVYEPGYEGRGVLWADLETGPVDEWLGRMSRGDEPFLLVVNDHSPHVIWPENPEYDPAQIDIPSFHIDTEDTRKARARYYTDITKMDVNFGELMQSLDRHGLKENTVVIFTADQGPQWAFGKWSLYDYGIRVPLLVHWPGVTNGLSETDALVSLVDVVPTLIEIAEGDAVSEADELDGKSWVPLLKGESQTHHRHVFASHTGDGQMNRSPMRMLRTDDYKYILNLAPHITYDTHMNKADDHDGGREYWPSWREKSFVERHAASVLWRYHNQPQEELYDLTSDPNESVNLAENPAYKEDIEEFRKIMEEWRLTQGDSETGPFEPDEGNRIMIHYILDQHF